jgi:hypothetical protein
MEQHQTDKEIKKDTEEALKKKTNQDFNGKKPLPNDPDLKKENPEPEVPGNGDDKKKKTEVTEDDGQTKGTTEQNKPGTQSTDKPLNSLPDETIAGDSDAPTIVNKEDDGKVF